jgi:hypothetical protein
VVQEFDDTVFRFFSPNGKRRIPRIVALFLTSYFLFDSTNPGTICRPPKSSKVTPTLASECNVGIPLRGGGNDRTPTTKQSTALPDDSYYDDHDCDLDHPIPEYDQHTDQGKTRMGVVVM